MNRTKKARARNHKETRRSRRRRTTRQTARSIRETRKVAAQGEQEQNTSQDNINFSPTLKQMEG